MLKIWAELYKLAPEMFSPGTTGPFCQTGFCLEGGKSCGRPISVARLPEQILREEYPLLFEEDTNENTDN